MSDDISISPFYHSAVNEVTKPSSLVFVSHYFADRWMRELGPVGTAIVIALRSHCYQNRSTGELRNRIQLPVPQIAAEIGVSAKTIRREMESNKTLQRFVQRREEYAPGPTPQSLRTDAYSYLVAMDDPVHSLDEERLQEAIREKVRHTEKGGSEEDAKARARQKQSFRSQRPVAQRPCGQIDHAEVIHVVKLSIPPGQIVPPLVKLSIPPGQIDHALIDSSDSLEFKENPSSDFSLSLFQEQEPEKTDPAAWAALTPEQQEPFRTQARHELLPYAVEAGPKAWARMGPRQEEVRARNLYEASRSAEVC